ncbi:MAG: hypothetical protein ACM3Q1_15670 [Bacteroidales bacterium]
MGEGGKTSSNDIACKNAPESLDTSEGGRIVTGKNWMGDGFTNGSDIPKDQAGWFRLVRDAIDVKPSCDTCRHATYLGNPPMFQKCYLEAGHCKNFSLWEQREAQGGLTEQSE